MKNMLKMNAYGLSDRGLVRENNEDYFCIEDELNLLIVCDGVGGGEAGEKASKIAAETIREYTAKLLRGDNLPFITKYNTKLSELGNKFANIIQFANKVVYEAAKEFSLQPGQIATTVVATLIKDYYFIIAHVGDTRGYLIRNGQIMQLTTDHTFVMEQVKQGIITLEEAKVSAYKNVLTRALGAAPDVEVDIDELCLKNDDYLLLCTDGLTNMVSEEDILKVVNTCRVPSIICEELVNEANKAGGKDNITVVVAQILEYKQKDDEKYKKFFKKIFPCF
jgi:protein phosphatase